MSNKELARLLIENIKSMSETNMLIYEKLSEGFVDCTPDAPIFQHLDKVIQNEIATTSKVTGISLEALNWFIYENEFGAREFKCSKSEDAPLVKIKSIDDFINFEKEQINV